MIYINGELVNFIQLFFEICKIKRVIANKKCFIDYNPLMLD